MFEIRPTDSAEFIVEKLIWYKGYTKIFNNEETVIIQQIHEDEIKLEVKRVCDNENKAKELVKRLIWKEQHILSNFY